MSHVVEGGLRFVLAGTSIVSDWGNPAATTNRAVMTALIELGHEATYLEPRRDPALVGLLQARGSEPMRAFLTAYPKLQYRTVDLPAPFQASAWAGQFLSTASAAIALNGCPAVVADGFQQFQSAGVHFLKEEPDGIGSVLIEATRGRAASPYRPAVLQQTWDLPRAGTLLVAYDDAGLARQVAEAVQPDAVVVSGRADLPDWEWVPEVGLPERYARAERVLVVDGAETLAPVRVWLARANGARAWGVTSGNLPGELIDVAVAIGGVDAIDWESAPEVPAEVDARAVAARLSAIAQTPQPVVSMNGKG
jgi:hypothetical protein